MKLTGGNRSTRRKTCPSATLSTTNPTWTDPGSKPGLRIEKPATNRLSHSTANVKINLYKTICTTLTLIVYGCETCFLPNRATQTHSSGVWGKKREGREHLEDLGLNRGLDVKMGLLPIHVM